MLKDTKFLTQTALMTVLIIVGRYLMIPLEPVPLTFQAFFVLFSGAIFGPKIGALSTFLYLFLGLIGLPVFTGGGGIGYVLKPTFGYIIGFIFGSYIVGFLKERFNIQSFLGYFIISFCGLIPIYGLGAIYFYFINLYVLNTPSFISEVVALCILTPLPNGIIHTFLIALIAPRLSRALKERNLN